MTNQCPTSTFQNVSQAAFNAIQAQANTNASLQQLGLNFSGNSGSVSTFGITLTWTYVPTPSQNNCGNLTINTSVGPPATWLASAEDICNSIAAQLAAIPGIIGANPCPPVNVTPGASLTNVTVTFDNSGSGKDDTENFWISLFPGGTSNLVASFAEASYPGPNAVGFSQNQPAAELLTISGSTTFSSFAPQSGGTLQIAVHGNFGGFHQNSDWKTGVTLDLTFLFNPGNPAGPTNPSWNFRVAWPEIDLHSDNSNPSATYTFNFVWNASSNSFVPQ